MPNIKEAKVEFLLFLDPSQGQFYSYCQAKGLLTKEVVPKRAQQLADKQIKELRYAMDLDFETEQISSFQKRQIPLSLILQRKFKYPVYYTQQYLPPAALQINDQILDYISAKIYIDQLIFQLQRSKKNPPPKFITVDIKLIASPNEVIRTINRVILQDFGVVITMKNSINKLIFKIKDKNEYLYGNQSIVNFQYIRQNLQLKKRFQLEVLQVSIYDKDQFLKFVFYRTLEDINRGQYPSFPWAEFFQKNEEEQQFLMWYVPDEHFTHPQTFIQIQKLYSIDQLIRTNEKIKLKLEEKRRLQIKKVPRFLWKDKINEFLQKRRVELKNKYVEIQGNVIYSGECCFVFQIKIQSFSNMLALFRKQQQMPQQKHTRKKFLKFQSKELYSEGSYPLQLPSMVSRLMQFNNMRRSEIIDIIPFMTNIKIEFAIGSKILYQVQTKFVLSSNHQSVNSTVSWNSLAKMPLQTCLIFSLQCFSREGEGHTYGVGVLKIFDQNGFLIQGEQEIHLYAMEKIQIFKLGCIDKHLLNDANIAKVKIVLPKYRNPVIWTLSDANCLKYLGYHPQIQNIPPKEEPNLERLNQLLRYDALAIYEYSEKDKELLRKCKKYYKHQSQKLINYLFAINWTEPSQVAEVYTALTDWAPLKPLEALFLLTPNIVDERVRYYAVRRMQNLLDYQFVLYSNQITQALVSFQTDINPLIDLIIQKCVSQPYTIGNEYFWQFKNRVTQMFTSLRFTYYLQCLLMMSSFRKDFVKQVAVNNCLIQMNEKLIVETQNLSNFKDKNTKFLSMVSALQQDLNKICPDGFLFPIRPQYLFKYFSKKQCKMYDSKKLPFSLACHPYEQKEQSKLNSKDFKQAEKIEPYRIMFKYGDDLKQDGLVLQMFRIFDKLWKQNGLDFKMNIYRTLSTGTQIGFIEIVDAQNNSKIHKDYGKQLVKAFDQKTTYFYIDSNNPQKKDKLIAKENYVRSSAGYLVATFIMGIGDRHSGNVMVQKNDFGHILGNFKTKFGVKRQRTPVLFTSEFLYMIESMDKSQFGRFQQLCSKAYNILRKNASLIVNLLIMMVSAQIPQLRSLSDIYYVIEKMSLDLSEAQAAEKLVNIIKQTLLSEKSRNLDNAFHEANRQG